MQMAIPFSIDASGSVAVVTDPVQSLADRVRALTATLPTQRAMRSNFGVKTTEVQFDWDPNAAQQHLFQMVQQAVALWEPTARVLAVQPVITPDGREIVGVSVDISAGDPVGSGVSEQYQVTISPNGDVSPNTVAPLNAPTTISAISNAPALYGDTGYGEGGYGGDGEPVSPYGSGGYGEVPYGGN